MAGTFGSWCWVVWVALSWCVVIGILGVWKFVCLVLVSLVLVFRVCASPILWSMTCGMSRCLVSLVFGNFACLALGGLHVSYFRYVFVVCIKYFWFIRTGNDMKNDTGTDFNMTQGPIATRHWDRKQQVTETDNSMTPGPTAT